MVLRKLRSEGGNRSVSGYVGVLTRSLAVWISAFTVETFGNEPRQALGVAKEFGGRAESEASGVMSDFDAVVFDSVERVIARIANTIASPTATMLK